MNVLSMLSANRLNSSPNVEREYVFPVRSHSFLPADRVFGRIEQDLKKVDTILLPEDYYVVLRRHGSSHAYGEDWVSIDHK